MGRQQAHDLSHRGWRLAGGSHPWQWWWTQQLEAVRNAECGPVLHLLAAPRLATGRVLHEWNVAVQDQHGDHAARQQRRLSEELRVADDVPADLAAAGQE